MVTLMEDALMMGDSAKGDPRGKDVFKPDKI